MVEENWEMETLRPLMWNGPSEKEHALHDRPLPVSLPSSAVAQTSLCGVCGFYALKSALWGRTVEVVSITLHYSKWSQQLGVEITQCSVCLSPQQFLEQ